jgi:Tfp pilus assembly protein PilE
MVAVTIFVLISLMAFAPYSYYINKSKVKQTGKEVSQLIYESKNMALNGIV